MLLSMTGHGEAHQRTEQLAVAVEVRSINSRYFKLAVRAGETFSSIEPRVEALIRDQVRRGTVQINLKIQRLQAADSARLNIDVLESYRAQLQPLLEHWQPGESVNLASLLVLPGIVADASSADLDEDTEWPVVEAAVCEAMNKLGEMRAREGQAMAVDLQDNLQAISTQLSQIAERAPQVVAAYRERLTDKLNKMLAEAAVDVEVGPKDLIREVGLFAERADISEEIVRLRSHLEQFAQQMTRRESSGRKLEFLTQEMFRETNTIGSKANDASIAKHVIDIKACIERMREMIQNVE